MNCSYALEVFPHTHQRDGMKIDIGTGSNRPATIIKRPKQGEDGWIFVLWKIQGKRIKYNANEGGPVLFAQAYMSHNLQGMAILCSLARGHSIYIVRTDKKCDQDGYKLILTYDGEQLHSISGDKNLFKDMTMYLPTNIDQVRQFLKEI